MFLTLLLGIVPFVNTTPDEFEVVEVNSVYNLETQALTFTQIFWREASGAIVTWRLVGESSGKGPACTYPTYNYRTKRWETTWVDGPKLRKVSARTYERTHSTYDPEREEREILEPKYRRELTGTK